MACELKAPFCVNLGAFADPTPTFMPRESLPSIDTVGWSLPYSGLTAALLPDGRVLHGRNADAALHEHRSIPHSADDGLLLIPAMLSSSDSPPTQLWTASAGILSIGALLLVCAAASDVTVGTALTYLPAVPKRARSQHG